MKLKNMPKRKDIKKILVIGAGPIIIGQACEFDYSGTQACKALKDEGYKVILVNSNPATIMTDPGVADQTYIEPISVEILEEIIKKEKPHAILPTMGGQTALNLALKAEKLGMLKTEREAMKMANGKYIAFCEGDDFWHNKQKLQLQIDFLEDNSDYGLVHSDVNHLYETENKIIENYNKTNSFPIPQGNIFLDLIDLNNNHGHLIKTMTACFRKDLFDKYWNYDLAIEKNWQLTDLPIWLELSKHCKVHYMSESLATYRLLSESASRSNNPKKLHAFHISVYEVRRHYAAKYNVSDKIIKNIEIHYHYMLLSDSYILRDSMMAKKAKSYLDKNQVSLSIKQKIKYYLTILPI